MTQTDQSAENFTAPLTSQIVAEHQAQHQRLQADAGRHGFDAREHRRAASVHAHLGAMHAALDQGDVSGAKAALGSAEGALAQTSAHKLPEAVRGNLSIGMSRAKQRYTTASTQPVAVAVGGLLSRGISPSQFLTEGPSPRAYSQHYDTALSDVAHLIATDPAQAREHLSRARASLNEVRPERLTAGEWHAYAESVERCAQLQVQLAPYEAERRSHFQAQARTYAEHERSLRQVRGTPAARRPVVALADGCGALSRAYASLAAGEGSHARNHAQSARLSADCAPLSSLPPDAQFIRTALFADADQVRDEAQHTRTYAFEVPVEATDITKLAPLVDTFIAPPQADEAQDFFDMKERLAAASMGAADLPTLSALGALSRAYAAAYGAVMSERREDGQAKTYQRRVRTALSGLDISGLGDRLPEWAQLARAALQARFG